MTKLSSNVTVRRVRVRGGHFKFRALRLDAGNFSWGSEVRVAGGGRRGSARLTHEGQCPGCTLVGEFSAGVAARAAERQRSVPPALCPTPLAHPPPPNPPPPPPPPLLSPQAVTRKTRILDVVYNASNNELVRTQTLVKSAIVQVDAAPFKAWYHSHYGTDVGVKKRAGDAAAAKAAAEAKAAEPEKKSNHAARKLRARTAGGKGGKLDPAMDDQFATGRLFASVSSRPGQCGRADGYILEGKELEFYTRKMAKKKGKA